MDQIQCAVCDSEVDFIFDQDCKLPVSVSTGLIIPSCLALSFKSSPKSKFSRYFLLLGEWRGITCCGSCHKLHQLWSSRFLYFEYMLLDGRLELSFDEFIEYGRANAKISKTVELTSGR